MNSSLNITTIDADYITKNLAALYMLDKNGHAAFIDTGTNHSFKHVLSAMQQRGITKENVDYVILTHIHLDHAGGASQMMHQFPNAKLVVHPFGSRHMADPCKLIAGATSVYGEQKFRSLYGEISPIDAKRIIESFDEMTLDFQNETLTFLDTPGHAKHHHCIYYESDNACFTGDTLGLAYPALNSPDASLCLLPTTTPVQFSPDDLHASINKVMSKNPLTLYPTHYGAIQPSFETIARLHEHIDAYVMLAEQTHQEGPKSSLVDLLTEKILNYMVLQVTNCNPNVDVKLANQLLKMDANLNAQGLLFWIEDTQSRA